MQEVIRGNQVTVRRLSKKGYIAVTVPRFLALSKIINEGDKLTPFFFNSVLVYVPDGIDFDFEKLKEAMK